EDGATAGAPPGPPAAVSARSASGEPATPADAAPSATPPAVPGKTYSPLVRRLAAEHGVDLATVTGTGEGGRIRREDVQAVIRQRPAATDTAPLAPGADAPAATAGTTPMGPQAGATAVPGVPDPRDRVEPLSRMRLSIAAGMVQSLQISPHVWTSIEVDYENVEIVRRRYKDSYKEATGASLSYLTFIARATADALLKYPAVNSSIDVPNKSQTFHPYVHLGIAVDLDEQGLLVPVVRDADQLNLKGLGTQI
ncbi:MAG: 2-oxo acid dehydrogenase subunit E2, partial [Propionibacteriaceae bacterium]|nr:2-oxo acid dehydrogenase subunit E2 [Propionibacteriaceae bacterium]